MGQQQSSQSKSVFISSGRESGVDPPATTSEAVQQHFHAEALYINPTIHYGQEENKVDLEKCKNLLRRGTDQFFVILLESGGEQLFPLDVVREVAPCREDSGLSGMFAVQREDMEMIEVGELFHEAMRNARNELAGSNLSQIASRDYQLKHGNVVGVVGMAGIGKSTLAKQFIQHLRETLSDGVIIFFISLRDFEESDEKMSVFKFLCRSCNLNWTEDSKRDEMLLEKISSYTSVAIILDGLDESKLGDLSSKRGKIGLYEKAKPIVILGNLLSGVILPNAQKLLLSRPDVYYTLHPSFRPHYTARVLGLSESSQDEMFRSNCDDSGHYEKLKEKLDVHSNAKAMCYVPVFAKLVIPYSKSESVFTMADVYTYYVKKIVTSPRFSFDDINYILELTQLAFKGIKQRKFDFSLSELEGCGKSKDELAAFIKLKLTESEISVNVLPGCKVYFFAHLTWQEFFAALYLMLVASLAELKILLPDLTKSSWEIVLQFIFGILNPQVCGKLLTIFPRVSKFLFEEKRKRLTAFYQQLAIELNPVQDFPIPLSKVFNIDVGAEWNSFDNHASNEQLLKLCVLAYESRKDEITELLTQVLPSKLLIYKNLQPSDVVCLCHVLQATESVLSINVGAYLTPAYFFKNSFRLFFKSLPEKHKVTKLHLTCPVNNDSVSLLTNHIQSVSELSLRNCELSITSVKKILVSVARRSTPLELLDLSENVSDEATVEMLPIEKIQRLVLMKCSLSRTSVETLAHKISTAQIAWLNLSRNSIDEHGMKALASCLHNVSMIWLQECNIQGSHLEEFCSSIKRLPQSLHLLSLSKNKIGDIGMRHLSTCVHNIEKLWLGNCDVTGENLHLLADGLRRNNKKLKSLLLSGNKLGHSAFVSLSEVLNRIEQLELNRCEVKAHDVEVLANAISNLENPISWLSLSGNNLGSSVKSLSKCLSNIKTLWLRGCNIRYDDLLTLTSSISCLETAMEFLDIGGNPIGAKGFEYLQSCKHKLLDYDTHLCENINEQSSSEIKIIDLDYQ